MTTLSTLAAELFARYRYPDWLETHSRLVGRLATLLAEAHRAAGAVVDVEAAGLAGYLHDLGRSPFFTGDPRDHNELSALVLAAEGLPRLVEPARRHPIYAVLDPATLPRTLEERIVFYADRRGGQTVVSIEDRIAEQIERYPEHTEASRRALPRIREIERELFAPLPFAPDELASRLDAIVTR